MTEYRKYKDPCPECGHPLRRSDTCQYYLRCGHCNKEFQLRPRKDYSGNKYGRLRALAFAYKTTRHELYYFCVCDCGTFCIKRISHMRHGAIRSCGCLAAEVMHYNGVTYGPLGTLSRLAKQKAEIDTEDMQRQAALTLQAAMQQL